MLDFCTTQTLVRLIKSPIYISASSPRNIDKSARFIGFLASSICHDNYVKKIIIKGDINV